MLRTKIKVGNILVK